MQERVQRMVDELRDAYQAQDLEVSLFPNHKAFVTNYNSVARRRNPSSTTIFGMAFVPEYEARDGKPHILVCYDDRQYPGGTSEAEITHEFSNHDVWRRSGEEMRLASNGIESHANSILQRYPTALQLRGLAPNNTVTFPQRIYLDSFEPLYMTV